MNLRLIAHAIVLATTLTLGLLPAADPPAATLKLTALTGRQEAIYHQDEPVTFEFTLTDQAQ